MALRKPSDFFVKKTEETNLPVVETDDTLREELTKVENLSDQIIQLQKELTQKIVKTDLESLVLSQINTMQEDFKTLQNEFKQSNEKDISKFRDGVSQLAEIVGNLIENEIPKYKKQVTRNELFFGEQIDNLKEVVSENITDIREEIGTKFDNIADVVDNNIQYFNQQLQETSSEVKRTVDTYGKLSKIVESRISKENDQLEEYSKTIQSLYDSFIELRESIQEDISTSQQVVEKKIESYKKELSLEKSLNEEKLDTYKNNLETSVDNRLEDYHKELSDVKADVVINEQHIKKVDKYLQEHHQELIELKEEFFDELEKLPVGNLQENIKRLEKKIDYIKETYSKIEPEVIVREVIKEGLLNEPPETKNDDPLTPLDQNFVTLDQLQQHYRLFINRIQQQLSTLGGGGETQLKYLDDIVGIATNASAYDGKFLKYNHSIGKFEFETVSGGSNNVDYATSSGIATYATIAGVSTALQNSRTFQITGDIIASPISFDGTGNVSLAATIQPNSVGLGTDTTGDYVQTLSGTTNQINITGGTGEGSTPVISIASNPTLPGNVTISNDLQVNNNLNVTGNITVGGTTAYIITNDFRVTDADIILGFTTDSYGNDVSNDTTANHGGIGVASSEGNPLVSLNIAGIETLPSTYKKIMWFKSGAFAGLNTDAWLINYAVGIGSTQFPAGTRLAAGAVQFTEQDLSVVRNINASGIVTASSLSVTSLNVSGVSTLGIVTANNIYSTGIVTTSAGQLVNGFPTFIQNTQPTLQQLNGLNKYLWWDTSGGNLTLWIETGN